MKTSRGKSLGLIVLAITSMMWGLSYIFTKVAVESLPPMFLAVLRFSLAVAVLFPIVGRRRGSFGRVRHRFAALAGFLGITTYFFFENYGLTLTNASDASLIVSTAPILTIILYDVLRRRFDYFEYIGGGIAFVGLGLIIYSGSFSSGSSVAGNLLSFGAALSWAGYTYFYERIRNSSIWTTMEIMLWGLVFSLPFAFVEIFLLGKSVSFSSGAVAGVIYLGLFASALGYILWNMGINLWGGKAATLWVYTIPIFTVVADVLFLKNVPSWLFFFGSALVGIGMVTVITREFRSILSENGEKSANR